MIISIIRRQNYLSSSSSESITPTGGYVLTEDSVTSAGVYNSDGTLLRTLWSNVQQDAGSYDAPTWDGLDDEGVEAVDATEIKILSNTVSYEWEGTIGNSSNINGGPTVHQNFDPINGMCQVGNYVYYTCGYNEHPPAWMKFHKDTPNIKIKVLPNIHYGLTATHTCTDGTVVYMAGYDPWQGSNARSMILGINPSDDTQHTFSSGTAYNPVSGHTYTSVIAYLDNIAGRPTGLSVGATHLFVSRSGQGKISVYNKTTGAFVRDLTFTTPKSTVCFGTSIWIISGTNTVAKYTVNSDGTLTSATVTLSGLVAPTFISVNSSGSVAVADESTSQQIKIFNASGTLTNTLGSAGGYNDGNPTVSTSKFFLTPKIAGSAHPYSTYVFFQLDDKLWIGDIGNFRCLRFSSSYAYEDQICYTGYFRSMGVDPVHPERIFCNYLEFELDYSVPLSNAAWTLVKNWSYNIETEGPGAEFHRLKWVQTLSNGRTYAFQQTFDQLSWELIELVPATGVRYTDITFSKANNTNFMQGGNIRTFRDHTAGIDLWWKERALTGFDGSNNPTWGTDTQIGLAPNYDSDQPVFMPFVGWNHPPVSDTDEMLISFEGGSANPAYASTKWHLGAVRKGESTWAWKTAEQVPGGVYYDGPYPDDGKYDIGNGTQYPGGIILCKEKSIFWGHHGEFWNNMQTNKIQHVYENGLLVGIFGKTGADLIDGGGGYVWDNIPYPGMAGNNIKGDIVKYGSDYYIFHCDEGHHGGVHKWKISNLDSIVEHSMSLIEPATTTTTTTTSTTTTIPVCTNLGITYQGNIAAYNDATNDMGVYFTVGDDDILVTELGRYRNVGSTLSNHTLKLWTNVGSVITSTTVHLADTSDYNYVYGFITPTVLTAGQSYYMTSSEVSGGDLWQYACPVTVGTGIAVLGGGGPSAGYSGANTSYGPVNFKYCILP